MKTPDATVMAGIPTAVILTGGTVAVPAATPDNVKTNNLKVSSSLTDKEMTSKPFHGEAGPPLDGVADRHSELELRAILVDSRAVFADRTIMPGFYVLKSGARTYKKFKGKTILYGQQVKDIIANLQTLKE